MAFLAGGDGDVNKNRKAIEAIGYPCDVNHTERQLFSYLEGHGCFKILTRAGQNSRPS
jgi:hypothetical protein